MESQNWIEEGREIFEKIMAKNFSNFRKVLIYQYKKLNGPLAKQVQQSTLAMSLTNCLKENIKEKALEKCQKKLHVSQTKE